MFGYDFHGGVDGVFLEGGEFDDFSLFFFDFFYTRFVVFVENFHVHAVRVEGESEFAVFEELDEFGFGVLAFFPSSFEPFLDEFLG